MLEACAPGHLPRREKQVVNFKSKVSLESMLSSFPGTSRDAAADDLFLVMQKAYTKDPFRKFVRAVNATPERAVVVTTDRQLSDLARFCTAAFPANVNEACPVLGKAKLTFKGVNQGLLECLLAFDIAQ